MALVGYGSSDEEDEVQPQQRQPASKTNNNSSYNDQPAPAQPTVSSQPAQHEQQPQSSLSPHISTTAATIATTTTTRPDPQEPSVPSEPSHLAIGPQIGPSAAPGPQDQQTTSFPPLEGAEDSSFSQAPPPPPPPQAPGSPYTSYRSTLRSLTLPTVPNLDIPPSPPPASPTNPQDGDDDQLTQKFTQFLDLKKRGVHFNSKIASSSALRNPSLTDKLLGFVDVDHKAAYANTLGRDIWDPEAFPRSSYKEQLRQSQADVAASRARGKGAPVAFVAASGAGVAGSSGQGVSIGGAQDQRKTRFDA